MRQAPPQHRPDHVAFRQLDLGPPFDIAEDGEIGNRVVVAAGCAKAVGRAGGNQPVANAELFIAAVPVVCAFCAERLKGRPSALDRAHVAAVLKITDCAPAVYTLAIAKIERGAAALACEELHVVGAPRVGRMEKPRRKITARAGRRVWKNSFSPGAERSVGGMSETGKRNVGSRFFASAGKKNAPRRAR